MGFQGARGTDVPRQNAFAIFPTTELTIPAGAIYNLPLCSASAVSDTLLAQSGQSNVCGADYFKVLQDGAYCLHYVATEATKSALVSTITTAFSFNGSFVTENGHEAGWNSFKSPKIPDQNFNSMWCGHLSPGAGIAVSVRSDRALKIQLTGGTFRVDRVGA